MAALHRPLYKVSFHLGGPQGGRGLDFGLKGLNASLAMPLQKLKLD